MRNNLQVLKDVKQILQNDLQMQNDLQVLKDVKQILLKFQRRRLVRSSMRRPTPRSQHASQRQCGQRHASQHASQIQLSLKVLRRHHPGRGKATPPTPSQSAPVAAAKSPASAPVAEVDAEVISDDAAGTSRKRVRFAGADEHAYDPSEALRTEQHALPHSSDVESEAPPHAPNVVPVKLEPDAAAAVDHAVKKSGKFADAAHAARYARFKRQLAPPLPGVVSRKPRPPPELQLKLNNAKGMKLEQYVQMFGGAGEDWKAMDILVRKSELNELTQGKQWIWKTNAELQKRYNK